MVRRTTSATYDEISYLQMAFRVREGNMLPLVRAGSAPLPILLDAVALSPFHISDLDTVAVRDIVARVRLIHFATLGFPLVMLVYVWLLRRRGVLVAGCGAVALALSPTFIAHASLATTDAAIACWAVVTIAVLAWHGPAPAPWQLALSALAFGMALGAKYSAVALLPAIVLAVGWRRTLAVSIGASVVVWALHGFYAVPLIDPDISAAVTGALPAPRHWQTALEGLALPAPLSGALHQWVHQRGGTNAFFLARQDPEGWWWSYFPVAFALKSTPVELLAALALPVLGACTWARRDRTWVLWLTALVSLSGVLLLSKVDIGIRYALPVYPLGALCVADAFARLPMRRGLVLAIALTSLAVHGISSVRSAPHYLSYFTGLVGGPDKGHLYLADSNLDWGQDLPSLAQELRRLGGPRVCLAYFGKAPVAPYGVVASDWRDPDACRRARWFAVSVTYLQVNYIDGHPFRLLLSEPPDRRAAYSIYLYDMQRPRVTEVLEQAWARGLHRSS